ALTGVQPARQKVMVKGGTLKDFHEITFFKNRE
ncbi:USP14 isoform 8, partial [Pongo abelii]